MTRDVTRALPEWCRAVWSDEGRGIALSAVMVLSMVALAFAGGAAGADGVESDITTDEMAEIDDALLDEAAEEPVTAIVRLGAADRSTLQGDSDRVVDQLQQHAEETQQPVLERAAETDSVDVLNQLWIANAVVVEADATGLEALAAVPGVDRIHANHEYSVPDPEVDDAEVGPDQDVTYGVDQINAPDVWEDFDNRGEGARVAILDTGVDDDHPDMPELSDEQWGHWDDDGDPIDSEPQDGNGHGTHVSGTAIGPTEPDGDVPGYGVAPEATLYHGKVLSDTGGGTFAQIAAGMQWTADEVDVDITSMSLGGGPDLTDLIEPSENLWETGVVLIASNGNNQIGAPGTYWSTFGSQAVDEDEQPASFADWAEIDPESFFGTDIPEHWPDEYITPHASAAGVGVLSAQAGGGYESLSGTSMSAPHHAGMFALMVSQLDRQFDHEELRQVAFDTARDPPQDDPIFGEGISDAHEAILEVNPLTADSVLGDVTETGEVTLTDALLVQEEVADVRDPDTPFFEFAGDLNRDGEVTGADATLAQERVAGTVGESEIAVDDLDAPPFVEGGDPIDVSAELENLGEIGALEDIEWRIAPEGEPLDEDAALLSQFVDMAPEGVEDPVAQPSEATIEFGNIDTGALPGGEYEHGVFTDSDSATADITVNSPFFEVTDIGLPADVPAGETFDVEAEITNTGNVGTTQTITYEFPATGETASESVSLNEDESTTVTFEDITADVGAGEYLQTVATEDESATANLTVLEPHFAVTDLNAPPAITIGEEITVDAVVENTGGLADEQDITYELDDTQTVAVVDETLSTGEIAERLAERTDLSAEQRQERAAEIQAAEDLSEFLDDELDDESFDVVDINSADLMDETDHDVYVINQFTEDTPADEFLDELGDSQATVHLDQVANSPLEENDGVARLVLDVGDPTEIEFDFDPGSGADLHIGADAHPILDGVGEPGETVEYHTADFADRAWYDGYSGETLAQVSHSGGTPEGDAVGVDDEENQVLLSSSGRDAFTPQSVFTEAENTLLLNAVEYAAEEQALGGDVTAATEQSVALDPGESAEVTFEYTVTEEDAGALQHVVASDDDSATAPVQVANPEQVNIVDLEAPESVLQGEELEVTATLEHFGEESTEQTASYLFDGDIEDEETFELDPGETTEVTLGTTVPVDQPPADTEHGVTVAFDEAFALVEVVEEGAPFFGVTGFDAPGEVDPGETIPVSATVTNTGDLAGTQTVEYEFDVETPELTPLDVALVDLGSDDSRNGGQLLDILEERFDEDDSITGYFEDDVDAWQDSVSEDEHDVHLIYSVDAETEYMEHFLEERGDDTTGVLLDNWDDSGAFTADAIFELSAATADPPFVNEAVSGSDDATMTIEQDHPIFEGVGEAGDTVQILAQTEDGGMIAWMEDYSAEQIATGSLGDDGGTTAAIDHERGLVLQSQLGGSIFEYEEDPESPFYDETFDIIHNSVEFAASGDLSPQTDATASDEVETDDDLEVAVVELSHTGGGSHGLDIAEILEDELDDATIDLFFQDAIDGGEDAEAWEAQLNDYDIHVVQAWGTHHSEHGTEHLEHFVETVDSTTAAVILDSYGDSSTLHSDGVAEYGSLTGDPAFISEDQFNTNTGAWLHAEQAHPIFEGVIDEGEETLVLTQDDDGGWFRHFDATDAEIIGTGQFGESGATLGPTVAVDEVRQVVLNSMLGGTITDPLDMTDAAHELLGNSVEFADEALLAEGEQFVSLEPGENETVEFDVTVPEVEAGEYGHGIFSANDSDTAPVTVAQLDEYELSNLDPEDAEVVVGEDGAIDVSVDVDNVGAQPGDQPVVLNVTEDETGELVYTDTVENVTIEPGEGQTVTFADVPANALDRGDYTHTVSSDDDAVAGSLSVFEEVFFEVSDLDAPAEVFGGETFDVSATVTNTVEEIPVAVVESDGFDSAPLVDELDERTGDRFAYETVDSEAFLESPDTFVGQYETVFIADLLDDGSLPADEDVEALVDAAEEAGTGLVFAEQYSTVPITALSSALDDPESASDAFEQGEPLIQVDAPDHPLFAGIEGEEFLAHDVDTEDYHSFEGYSGEVLADVAPGGDVDDSAIGIDDEAGHVLLGTVTADDSFVDWSDLTEESWTVLANSVEYLAGDADVSPAFTDTQTIEYVLDGTVEDSEELTLDAGESDTVTFDDIPAELAPGTYEHGIESADDAETATIDIVAGAEYELSNLDPAEAEVGEDDDFIDVSVDVENVGDTTQPLDVDLAVVADAGDGEVAFEDTVAGVEVDPGVTETVTFEDVPVGALDGGEYEHTVSTVGDSISGSLTVLEPVFFEVSELDGPDSVESGGAVTVSANVTNSLPPEPDEAVVSVVDSTFAASEAGALVDHLESTLGEGYLVEQLSPDELLSNPDSDVYVLQEFGEVDAGEFLGLLGDDQAVVALDQDGDDADAVTSLANDTGEPDAVETDAIGGPHANLEVTAEHPIFDGVGDVGETITYHEGFDADRGWFEGYAGDSLAEIQAPADEIDTGGPAVGVDDDTNQVLLPSSARTTFVNHEEFTDAEHTLVTNAVAYAATEQAGVEPGVTTDGDVGADETATQVVEYRVDGETLDEESVTLDAGESQTVTFDDVTVDFEPGEYEHGVFSIDDEATATLTVTDNGGDDAEVAVVNPEQDDSVSTLMDELESDTNAATAFVESDTLVDNPESVMADHDAVVFLHYGFLPFQEDVEPIRNAARDTDTGLVHLDPASEKYGEFFGNTIWALPESFEVEPTPNSITATGVDAEQSVEVAVDDEDSPLFDGIEADQFAIRSDDVTDHETTVFDFPDDADVERVGFGVDPEDGTQTDPVAVEDPNNPELYLSVGANGAEQSFADHTDDALQLIANGVASVSDAVTADSSESTRTAAVAVP